MKDPTGERYDVPAEQAMSHIRKGYIPESAAEEELADFKNKQTTLDQVRTTLGGALSTYSYGGFDALVKAVSPEAAEIERKASIVNPVQRSLGEAVGMAAPVAEAIGAEVLTGGAATPVVAARAGLGAAERTGAEALTRFAAMPGRFLAEKLPEGAGAIARGAVEHSVTGALEGSRYSFGRELSRQSLGNEDYNVEKLLAAGGEGLLFGGVTGGALGAGGAATRVLGRQFTSALTKEGEGGLTFAERRAAEAFGIDEAAASRVGIDRVKTFAREALDRKIIPESFVKTIEDSMVQKSAKVSKLADEVGEKIGAQYKKLDELGHLPAMDDVQRGWAEIVGNIRDRGYEKLADRIEGSDYWNAVMKKRLIGFERLHAEDTAMRKLAESVNIDKLEGATINQLRGSLKEGLMKAVGGVDPGRMTAIAHLDRLYGALAEVAPIVENKASRAELRGAALTPFDIATAVGGVMAFGHPAGAAIGATRAVAKSAYRSERIQSMLARVSDNIAKASKSTSREIESSVEKAAQGSALKIDYAKGVRATELAKSFYDRHNAVTEAQTNREAFTRKLGDRLDPLVKADPVYGRKAIQTTIDDVKYLGTKAPKALIGHELTKVNAAKAGKHGAKLDVPSSEAASFVRATKALTDPLSEVKGLKNGSWSPEFIDVLNERRPLIKEALITHYDKQVVELAEQGKKMSFDARVTASLVTGKSYDPMMEPQNIKFIQDHWAEKRSAAARSPAPGGMGGVVHNKPSRSFGGHSDRYKTGAEQVMSPSDL